MEAHEKSKGEEGSVSDGKTSPCGVVTLVALLVCFLTSVSLGGQLLRGKVLDKV